MDLVGDDDNADSLSSEWLNEVDRGGLWHVNENTYMTFVAMEEEIRRHLRNTSAPHMVTGYKEKVVKNIASNEDVLFYWSMAGAEIDDEEGQILLGMVIEHWVTVRGFSFASGWIEQYKQATQKTIQRSKALRRKVYTFSQD